MIISYKLGVHAWLQQMMTPEKYSAYNHYGSISLFLKEGLKLDERWFRFAVNVLGHSSYILIATFGIIVFSIVETSKRIVFLKRDFLNHD